MQVPYRVDYGPGPAGEGHRSIRPGRTVLLSILFSAVFLWGCCTVSPRIRELVCRLLPQWWDSGIGSDLEQLAGMLRSGLPFGEAVSTFCRGVLSRGMEYAG